MTREQMVTLIRSHIQRDDKDDVINAGIDFAMSEFSKLHDFRSLRVTTDLTLLVSTQEVTLPVDFYHVVTVLALDGSQSYPIRVRTKTWLTERFPDFASTIIAAPHSCCVDGSKLVFVPKADKQYTIRLDYRRRFPTLSDTDAPSEPLENAVVAWATSYAFRSVQLHEDATFWMREADRAFTAAVTGDVRRGEHHGLEEFTDVNREPVLSPWQDPFNTGRNDSHYS